MDWDFKSIRVLRYNLDDTHHEDFEEGDIVDISTHEGMFGNKSYEGKITWIDTEWIEVDCSTLYKNNLKKFSFKDIQDINKINVANE